MAILEPVTLDRAEQKQFLRFEDAVTLSRGIENFFNSKESDEIIFELANKFNLGIKENFIVNVPNIEKNCQECMGCHAGGCILGCFITEPGEPQRVCFWDEAIEAVIGTKLVIHEYGHVIFEQIFTNKLNESDSFQVSEEFAQFMENNFTISLGNCIGCSIEELSESSITSQNDKVDQFTVTESRDKMIEGFLFGLGLAVSGGIIAILISRATRNKDNDFINRTK